MSRQDVLALLREQEGAFVSGEEISHRLGLSRAAIWKAVDALRREGYTVEARTGRGYRLLDAPDVLTEPEIRRFLERVGSSRMSKVFVQPPEAAHDIDSAISQTVEAYTSLSKDKVGALMVFERQNLLDDAIKTGTVLDCAVNAELLKNIFWNKAPLHDGAVIVRAGRIVGAGCMLPMSGNVNLSRELGMRHRAGIGASEHTDAVVAIVSEETGSISVAVGGMLKRHLAPETLERLLRNELLPERENDEAASKFKLGNLLRFGKGKKQDGNENS